MSDTYTLNYTGSEIDSILGQVDDFEIANPTDGQGIVFNGTTQKWVNGNVASGDTILTQTLTAGNTQVVFTGIPTTGDNLISVFTDVPGLEYESVTSSGSGQLTYTFEAQQNTVNVYLVIKEV